MDRFKDNTKLKLLMLMKTLKRRIPNTNNVIKQTILLIENDRFSFM